MNFPTQVLIATTNKGKQQEIASVLAPKGIAIRTPQDFSIAMPQVDENEPDYQGNAVLKAKQFYRVYRIPCLSDDTGLEVDALGGAPGLYSARYAGEDATPQQNISKLLSDLSNIRNRKAKFVCVLALLESEDSIFSVRAELTGEISYSQNGTAGFGYDSVFIVEGTGMTLAELKQNDPLFETHRVKALQEMYKLFARH